MPYSQQNPSLNHLGAKIKIVKMQEILTLSLSQSANSLTTHFYNAQESYMDYTTPLSKQKDKLIDSSVHFKPTISSNSVNYTPRALLWDLNGGYGALSQFEYFSNENNGSEEQDTHTTISNAKIEKHLYQQALDEGKQPQKLTSSSIRYWSDFSRVMYEPKSYNVLQNWEFDPVKYPKGRLTFGKERDFIGYEVGVQEFNDNSIGLEFLEEKYRVSLEECDLLNGINIISELDSSWAGFGAQMLDTLRDDYNPKSEIFSFLLYDGLSSSFGNKQIWDRIRGFLKFQKESSLILPFDKNLSGYQSKWEQSAVQNVVFETLQVLGSQNSDRKNFHEIESSLTLGNQNRNVVSKIQWESAGKLIDLSSSFFQIKVKNPKESICFSTATILRPSDSLDLNTFLQETPFDSKEKNKTQFISNLPYATPDSYPEGIISCSDNLKVELSVESSIRKSVLEMKDFVSKFIRGDERSDAIDSLSTIAQEYENGFYDSDEESDDDY